MDLYATFLELADIQIPQDRIIDGQSLVQPLLNATNFDRSEYIVCLGIKRNYIFKFSMGSAQWECLWCILLSRKQFILPHGFAPDWCQAIN